MCIGDMSLPKVGAVIPTARKAQLPEEAIRSTPASAAAPGSAQSGAAGEGIRVAIGATGVSSNNLLIPDDGGAIDGGDGDVNDNDGGGTKRNKFPGQDDEGGTGIGDGRLENDDDEKNKLADDEGDPTDDTKDKIKEREEEEGATTSPARIVSPLIRAVQGERQINRRGRNALFIQQGTGVRRVEDGIVNSSGTRPPQTFVSPFESGLIPLRR